MIGVGGHEKILRHKPCHHHPRGCFEDSSIAFNGTGRFGPSQCLSFIITVSCRHGLEHQPWAISIAQGRSLPLGNRFGCHCCLLGEIYLCWPCLIRRLYLYRPCSIHVFYPAHNLPFHKPRRIGARLFSFGNATWRNAQRVKPHNYC